MKAEPLVAVDARHLKSGIGTYLKNLIPELVLTTPWRWRLIGPDYWKPLANNRVTWVESTQPIYTIKEHQMIQSHAQGADLLWVPQYNAPWFWKGRLVVTLHDLIHRMPEYTRVSAKSLLSRCLMSHSLSKADRIVTVSTYSRQRALEFFPKLARKVTVIPNGVTSVPKVSQKPSFSDPYILSFGNALPHKNFARLIEAFAKIRNEVPHHLVLAGPKGRETPHLQALANQFSSRVHLYPEQSSQEWAQWLRHADLYVCPSLEEGFGLPPLEALSVGVPVAASQVSSLPEVLGEAAFWFDPRDTTDMARVLKEALVDTEHRQEVVVKGQERLNIFTWKKSIKAHAQVFQEVLGIL